MGVLWSKVSCIQCDPLCAWLRLLDDLATLQPVGQSGKTCSLKSAKGMARQAHKPLQLAIEDEVEVVCETLDIGEAKVGDLTGIRVHKFRFSRQEYLIAYRAPKKNTPLAFLIIDFYAELKQYLRQEKAQGEAK
jgi:hypothetical protein